jgi:hypothetical protein
LYAPELLGRSNANSWRCPVPNLVAATPNQPVVVSKAVSITDLVLGATVDRRKLAWLVIAVR